MAKPQIIVGRDGPIKTFTQLDIIVSNLGATKLAFWPFMSGIGSEVFAYGTGNDAAVLLASDENGVVAVESEFDPMQHVGNVFSYYNDSSTNNHLNGEDDADYSHGNGTVDTAFSCGAWIMPTEALGTARSIISKFGLTANVEEWDFRTDTSGNLLLELHDASASASEIGTGASDVIVPFRWQFVVATYDGTETAPEVHLYRDASDTLASGATTESGSYVSMEDGAADLLVGARDDTGTPKQEFEGRIALPFQTGKELTQAEVTAIFNAGKILLGI